MLERGDLLRPRARGRHRLRPGPDGQPAAGLCGDAGCRGAGPPAGRPASASSYTGIELMPKDVARAQARWPPAAGAAVHLRDMCQADVPPATWWSSSTCCTTWTTRRRLGVLQRCARRWAPQGRLLLRVGDAANQRGFAISQWVDRVVTVVRGHRVPPTWGRTLQAWTTLLQGLGFVVRRRAA
jgi:hypothetical protein